MTKPRAVKEKANPGALVEAAYGSFPTKTQAPPDEFEHEAYPEGYAEALADCTVLAAKLLRMALASDKKRVL